MNCYSSVLSAQEARSSAQEAQTWMKRGKKKQENLERIIANYFCLKIISLPLKYG